MDRGLYPRKRDKGGLMVPNGRHLYPQLELRDQRRRVPKLGQATSPERNKKRDPNKARGQTTVRKKDHS